MNNGKVSIIIPFFNSAQFINETLQSIVGQSYLNWECICVDDGSTDGSDAVIKKWSAKNPKIKYFERPEHLPAGGNAARNFGFEVSEGEFIQWFDSDDIMHEDMLSAKVESLILNKTINYVICRTAYFENDDVSEIVEYEQNLDSSTLYIDYLTYKTKFFTPGPLFRKSFIQSMEHFDVRLKRHQEREFFFRVILKDSKFTIIDLPLVFRRVHNNQLSHLANNSLKKNELKFVATNLIFQNYCVSPLRDRQVNAYFRLFFAKHFKYFFIEKKYNFMARSFLSFIRSLLK